MRLDCIGLDAVEIVLATVVKGRIDKKKIKKIRFYNSLLRQYGTCVMAVIGSRTPQYTVHVVE